MPRRMAITCVVATLALVSAGLGDTLTLKDGRVINGTYLGGTARQIRMEVGDSIQTYEIDRVSGIQFGYSTTATTAPAPQRAAEPAPRERVSIFRPESSAQTSSAPS